MIAAYFLQTYLLSSDFRLGSCVRLFTELQSGLENGRNGGPRLTDLDRLDVHQVFLEWKVFSSEGTRWRQDLADKNLDSEADV